MTLPEPRTPARATALLLACMAAFLTACPAQQRRAAQSDRTRVPATAQPGRTRVPATGQPAQPGRTRVPATGQPERAAERARLIVAVAELAGDRDHLVKQRVLAHLRAFAMKIEVLDLAHAVLASDAPDALSPLDILQDGHGRARALLDETGAGALIWGTAGAPGATPAANATPVPGATPVLYVTTAESSHWPCDSDLARTSEDEPAAPGQVLCALDTGATWLLCATAWSRIVPVGCASGP